MLWRWCPFHHCRSFTEHWICPTASCCILASSDYGSLHFPSKYLLHFLDPWLVTAKECPSTTIGWLISCRRGNICCVLIEEWTFTVRPANGMSHGLWCGDINFLVGYMSIKRECKNLTFAAWIWEDFFCCVANGRVWAWLQILIHYNSFRWGRLCTMLFHLCTCFDLLVRLFSCFEMSHRPKSSLPLSTVCSRFLSAEMVESCS